MPGDVKRTILSSEEFRVAVDSLSQYELLRLYKKAVVYALGTGMSAEDLLHEAILRTLDEDGRNCPADVPIYVYLSNAMKSIASGERKKYTREVADGDGTDEMTILGMAPAEVATPEQQTATKIDLENVVGRLQEVFENDPQGEAILIGEIEGWGPTEIKELEPMDDNEYAAARKRVRRRIAQEFPEEDRQ